VDDRGVRAFVEAAARARPDGQVELAFPPEWEMWIYETMPHDLWPKLRRLQVPLLLVYGEESDTFLPGSAHALRRALPQAELHGIRGAGHLVPLEQPAEVGAIINRFLESTSQMQ
jgi:pimeloyl-ACP methyl ester carboxylesterase